MELTPAKKPAPGVQAKTDKVSVSRQALAYVEKQNRGDPGIGKEESAENRALFVGTFFLKYRLFVKMPVDAEHENGYYVKRKPAAKGGCKI